MIFPRFSSLVLRCPTARESRPWSLVVVLRLGLYEQHENKSLQGRRRRRRGRRNIKPLVVLLLKSLLRLCVST